MLLIPDLWLDEDRAACDTLRGEALADLVEGRIGVRPLLESGRIWAIVTPASTEMRAWNDAMKIAFLENHETRHWLPREREGRGHEPEGPAGQVRDEGPCSERAAALPGRGRKCRGLLVGVR
jgi:hypothetical protein